MSLLRVVLSLHMSPFVSKCLEVSLKIFFDKDVNSKQDRAEYSFLRVNRKSKIYISNVCLFSMLKRNLSLWEQVSHMLQTAMRKK